MGSTGIGSPPAHRPRPSFHRNEAKVGVERQLGRRAKGRKLARSWKQSRRFNPARLRSLPGNLCPSGFLTSLPFHLLRYPTTVFPRLLQPTTRDMLVCATKETLSLSLSLALFFSFFTRNRGPVDIIRPFTHGHTRPPGVRHARRRVRS